MVRLVRPLRILAAAVALFVAAPMAAEASPKKLDHALREVRTDGSVRVIIRTVDRNSAAALRTALREHGDRVAVEHPSILAVTADVHTADLRRLAARADVASIALDAEVRPSGAAKGTNWKTSAPTDTLLLRSTLGYGASFYGMGVGVAVIDSGIAPLPAFAGRITAFYDFTRGTVEATTPSDEYGHGTHVAGLIAAFDANYMGVAPAARLIGLKVLDSNGKGRTSDVIRALEFAVANRTSFGIDVVNLSIGHPIFAPAADDPLVHAVESAVRAGLVVVVSAGNYGTNRKTGEIGYAGITSPGNAPSAITVGAADTKGTVARFDDEVTAYSSRGPTWFDAFAKPDVVAPGHQLRSTASISQNLYRKLVSQQWRKGSSRYLTLSGTSMATGVTSGVVATMLEANALRHFAGNARLTPNAVKAMLQYSATPVSATGTLAVADGLTQGTGEVNAEGALRLAAFANTAAPVGTLWMDPSSPQLVPQSTFSGQTVDWAAAIVWGDSILWGNTVFANEPAWATAIVWGDAAFADAAWSVHVQWADNIVWSMSDDAIVWGENIVWAEDLLRAADDDAIVWGDLTSANNIVWSNLLDDNIVWGNLLDDNIVWSFNVELTGGLR